MKKITYIACVLLLAALTVKGQDQYQAFRYSQNYITGTARFTSMGGAFGAVGGDFTAASVNPAGLGFFRSSEFTITPVYSMNNSTSGFLGNSSKDFSSNFNIGNLGLVTNISGRNSNIGVVFGFGYNALNNFHSTTTMMGVNDRSSLLDNFTWFANNSNELDIFYEGLANDLSLVPLDTVTNTFFNDLETAGYGQEQIRVIEHTGYLGEYAFSGALNFGHRLFIGGSVGIHAVRFYEEISHIETDIENASPFLESFSFDEYNSTTGAGVALKVGVIFKPIHALRLGAAFHAPVVYSLTDDKFTEINTFWDRNSGFTNEYGSSGLYSKDYTLRTPFRASASAAFLLGKLGLVSAEYEYVDYTTADLDSPGYNFADENIAITRDFRAVHHLKAGAEIRLSVLSLRAGVQYYMNPYAITSNGSDLWVYSCGVGFRAGPTFIDVAYSLGTKSELYGLYFYNNANGMDLETSQNDFTNSKLMFTLGYKF